MNPFRNPGSAVAALLALVLVLTACPALPGGDKGEAVTRIAPQVKIGLPQAGPGSLCSQTVRYAILGDEIDPGVPGFVDFWAVDYEQIAPIDFIDPASGDVSWHCVFGSPFAVREPSVELQPENSLRYEVLGLLPEGEDPWDPQWLVIYQGTCGLYDAIVEDATNYVNFTTLEAGCLIGTSPLLGFP